MTSSALCRAEYVFVILIADEKLQNKAKQRDNYRLVAVLE